MNCHFHVYFDLDLLAFTVFFFIFIFYMSYYSILLFLSLYREPKIPASIMKIKKTITAFLKLLPDSGNWEINYYLIIFFVFSLTCWDYNYWLFPYVVFFNYYYASWAYPFILTYTGDCKSYIMCAPSSYSFYIF